MNNMSKKTFAYIRVSIKDQIETRQLKEILELGVNERDLLYVKSIGRFGRTLKR